MAQTRRPSPSSSYAARKARAAARGTTPYRERIAREMARGKTRAEARGHKNERAEKARRAEATRRQYGVSPDTLRRLRRQAAEHIENALRRAGTKGPVNRDTIEKGLRGLTADGLRGLLGRGTGEEAEPEAISPGEIKRLSGYTYAQLIEDYPEYENDDELNPFWYH
jgi:hypothetical protein